MKTDTPQSYSIVSLNIPVIKESKGPSLRDANDVRKFCDDITNLAQEVFLVVTNNTKNQPVNKHQGSVENPDASLVHAREVFKRAIIDDAASIILVHNHPSGDPTPSAEDIRITRQIVEAGKLLDIPVLDHVIIGRPNQVSLRESGLVAF